LKTLAALPAVLALVAAEEPRFDEIVRSRVEMHAAFSPDGRFIAYTTNRDGNDDVFVEPLDGSSPARPVTRHAANDRYPSFSPDGSEIAFQSDRSGSWDVFVVRIGKPDEEARCVASGPSNDVFPSFTPDGRSIVFGSDRETGKGTGARVDFDLYSVPKAGGDAVLFEGSTDREICVAFSRDGLAAAIPAVSETGPAFTGRVRVKDLKSGATRVLSGSEAAALPGGYRTEAAFSSDGTTLVATVLEDGASRFRFLSAVTGESVPAPAGLPDGGALTGPAFSPDGRFFAFVHSSIAVPPAIFLLDLGSGAVRRLHAPARSAPAARDRLERFRSRSGDIDVPARLVLPPGGSGLSAPPRAGGATDEDPALSLSSAPIGPAAGGAARGGTGTGKAAPAAAEEGLGGRGGKGLVLLLEGSIPRFSFARADLWRPDVQFFAESGYAVLVVYPRGSRGFGRAHLGAFDPTLKKAGEDVLGALEGISRLGLAGSGVVLLAESWGSLAATSALAAAPAGTFRCAIFLSPAIDLAALLDERPYFEVVAEETFGIDPADRGRARLGEISPLLFAPRIEVPLLVAHGAKDEVLPVGQSRALVRALESAGRGESVTYLEFPESGHGLLAPDFAQAIERARAIAGATPIPARD